MTTDGRRVRIVMEEWSKGSNTPLKVLDTKTHNLRQASEDAMAVMWIRNYLNMGPASTATLMIMFENALVRNRGRLKVLLDKAEQFEREGVKHGIPRTDETIQGS